MSAVPSIDEETAETAAAPVLVTPVDSAAARVADMAAALDPTARKRIMTGLLRALARGTER